MTNNCEMLCALESRLFKKWYKVLVANINSPVSLTEVLLEIKVKEAFQMQHECFHYMCKW